MQWLESEMGGYARVFIWANQKQNQEQVQNAVLANSHQGSDSVETIFKDIW